MSTSEIQWAALARVMVGTGAAAAVLWACTINKNPHDDDGSSFPLIGRHDAIACEACHTTGDFEALNPACESCHEAERPEGHYRGSCGNAGCHIPAGWKATGGLIGDDDDDDTPTPGDDDDTPTPGDDDDTTTPGDDDDTPTGDDDDTPTGDDDDTTTTGNFHETFPLEGPHDRGCTDCHANLAAPDERLVCLDCHEADRKDPGHYTGQDCAHCHPVEPGWGDNSIHPFRLAHPRPGTQLPVNDGCVNNPAPVAVELCDSCHPVPTDRAGSFDCVGCHLETETDCRHGALPGYVFDNPSCLSCHPTGY